MALNPSVTTLSGLATDRPATPTQTGLHYYATDTNALTVWDGAAWQTVGGGATGGTVAIILATATGGGVAATFLRDDDTIKAFDGTLPGLIASGAGIDGTTSFAQRSGHSHQHPAFAGGDLHQDYVLAAGTRPLSAQWGVGPFSFLVTGSATPSTPGTAGLRAVWSNNDNSGMKVITKAGNTYSLEGATLAKSIGATGAGDVVNSAVATKYATTYTIPANALSTSRTLRVEAFGIYSASASTTSTMQFLIDSTAFGTGGAVAPGAQTNRGWNLWGLLQCRATGSAGAAEFQGLMSYNISVTGQAAADMENTTSRTIDTTASHVLALSHTFNATSASTSTNLRNLAVEWLGPEVS